MKKLSLAATLGLMNTGI